MDFDLDIKNISDTLVEYISLYGLKVIAAIAIFIVGKWVARKAVNFAKKLMKKANVDDMLISFSANILYTLALAFVTIAALSKLGIETTSLAAIIAAAGLAIGLALQGSLSNLAAGVMIILFRPFKTGDYVEAGGAAGTVEEITIFTTIFKTPDNRKVIVPNNSVTSGTITNYSAKPERRVDLVVGVGYDDDLAKVKSVLSTIVSNNDKVLKDKDVTIAVSELADNSVNLIVRPWVKSADYWAVFHDLTETIKTTFDKEGISIPYPQRDLHIIDGSEALSKAA